MALKDEPLTADEVIAAGSTTSATGSNPGVMVYGSDSAYAYSSVKSVVNYWETSKFTDNELKTVNGYKARLITVDEYREIPTETRQICTYKCFDAEVPAYDWMYSDNYGYWTMSPYNNSSSIVWKPDSNGFLGGEGVYNSSGTVRPVINVYKDKITQS